MKVLIFDFEVFKYDVLLGIYDANSKEYIQTWDKEKIKQIYRENPDAIWVGHNNSHYDNFILQAILFGKDPYSVSKEIIDSDVKQKLKIKLWYYDIMTWHFVSLKVLEAQMGKNISESEVDFNLDRPLTDQEKKMTESYNRDDLDQTYADVLLVKPEMQLRLDIAKEFGLDLGALHYTEAQIAAKVLRSKRIEGADSLAYEPTIPSTLRLNDERLIRYYVDKEWETIPSIKFTICGLEHTIAKGGIHAAAKKAKCDWAYYLDVSGYYNLVMINYDLLPRTIDDEGKKLYEYMYHEQLRLKGVDDVKRGVYKTILLAVFGASTNKYTDFYDPNKGKLVTILGELFLVDLLEKLDGKVELIQSNTDGIIVKPIGEDNVLEIVREWCDRTHFVIKPKKIYDIVQRDVNCYMYRDEKKNIHVKGNSLKYYEQWDNPFLQDSHTYSSPYIIHYCIVEYYMNGIDPKETVEKYRNEFRMFQYICKLNKFDYLTFESRDKVERLQKVNRVFASKKEGRIYKNDVNRHNLYENLPESVFVYNGELNPELADMIDYDYYVKRAWKGINEFRNEYEQLTLF